jgi:hypothetical protein
VKKAVHNIIQVSVDRHFNSLKKMLKRLFFLSKVKCFKETFSEDEFEIIYANIRV